MAEWLQFQIPAKLVGEIRVSGNDYIQTYRTEILLPTNSQYPGYCFLHPSKLVSSGRDLASITYNDTFTFTLVKKDRETGKKYKRFTLTAAELITIYAPEVAKIREKLARKEERRLAQIGTVEVLECRGYQKYYWVVAFRHGKKLFWGNGKEFIFKDEIHTCRVIADNVSRSRFESVTDTLEMLCEDYRILQDVRLVLNQGVKTNASDKTVAVYDSFYTLADQWEAEFHRLIAETIESAKGG